MIRGCLKLGLPTSPGKGLFLQETIRISATKEQSETLACEDTMFLFAATWHLICDWHVAHFRPSHSAAEDGLWPRSHLCFATSTLWIARRYQGAWRRSHGRHWADVGCEGCDDVKNHGSGVWWWNKYMTSWIRPSFLTCMIYEMELWVILLILTI